MNKWCKLIALLLALLMLGGCNLIATDPEMEAKIVVAKVDDDVITRGEAQSAFLQTLYETANYYQMFGYQLDTTDESIVGPMREDTLNGLVEDIVLKKKAAELGLDTFTAEELAGFDTDAQAQIDSDLEYVKTLDQFADSELPEDELQQQMMDYMEEIGVTKEVYAEDLQETAVRDRMRAEAIKDVAVSDAEVQELYDTRLAEQQAKYEEDPTAYATDFSGGSDIFYTPAGYRFIKHVLVKLTAEDSAALSELQTQLSTLETTEADLNQQLADLDAHDTQEEGESDEAHAAHAEDRAAIEGELQALSEEKATLQTEIDTLTEAAYAAILPKAEEVLAKAKLGLNFDKLVESYGEDPGMQSEPAKSHGYPVTEGLSKYEVPFQEAAMALANVGDLSEPVKGANGYHILMYDADAAEGATPLADLQEKLHSELLSTRQDETYAEALAQWKSEHKIQTWPDKMK